MRKKKTFLILVCMAVFLLPGLNAGESSTKIYYHWLNDHELLLWKGEEEKQVTAVFADQTWQLDPQSVMSDEVWNSLLKENTPQEFIKLYETDPSNNKELWEAFLNYIREKKPGDREDRVKLLYPDIYVFLRPVNETEVELTFILNKDKNLYRYTFTQNNEKKWGKRVGIPLGKYFEIQDEMEVFKMMLKDNDTKNAKFTDLWDKWIKQINTADKPSNYMYKADDSKPRWAWVEQVETVDIIKRMRSQPPKPDVIDKIKTKTVTEMVPWQYLLLGGFILFLITPLGLLLGHSFKKLLLKMKKPLPDDQIKESFESMQKEDVRLKNRVDSLIQKRESIIMDSMKKKDEKLKKKLDDLIEERKNLIQENTEKLKGISENREYIELGKAALPYYKEAMKKEKYVKQEDWIKKQFDSLEEKDKEIEEKNKRIDELVSEKTSITLERDKIFKGMGTIDSIEGESSKERLDAIKNLITKKDKDFDKLQKDFESKTSDLKEKEDQIERINTNIDRIVELIPSIDSGLQKVLDHHKDKDPQIAAMISFLTYYSLFHYSNAVVKNEELKKKIMLSNLNTISNIMKESHPVFKNKKIDEFDAVFKDINDQFPGVADQEFKRSEASPKPKNAKLISTLLKRLKDLSELSLDIVRYNIEVDDAKRVHQVS